jgi:hypothetical protein
MQLSDCLVISPAGILLYLGHKGQLYQVIGGDKNGHLQLQPLP